MHTLKNYTKWDELISICAYSLINMHTAKIDDNTVIFVYICVLVITILFYILMNYKK